jgi:hypothetical protein
MNGTESVKHLQDNSSRFNFLRSVFREIPRIFAALVRLNLFDLVDLCNSLIAEKKVQGIQDEESQEALF